MLEENTFHLRLILKNYNNATLAILTGDPNRVKKIALSMENPKYLSSNREFTIWSAEISENVIIICSTGIGGSSTSIAIEELTQIGIRTFLRIGTAGAIQPYIKIGDMLVVTAAVRCDGASKHFAPLEFPAVSDLSCSLALIKATKIIGVNSYTGITVSSDTFYPGQERKNTYSKGYIIKQLKGSLKEWRKMGVMSYEMEAATLFTMCASQPGLRAGAILGIIVNRLNQETPNFNTINNIENTAIKIVIEAIRILLSTKYYFNNILTF